MISCRSGRGPATGGWLIRSSQVGVGGVAGLGWLVRVVVGLDDGMQVGGWAGADWLTGADGLAEVEGLAEVDGPVEVEGGLEPVVLAGGATESEVDGGWEAGEPADVVAGGHESPVVRSAGSGGVVTTKTVNPVSVSTTTTASTVANGASLGSRSGLEAMSSAVNVYLPSR